MKIKRSKGYRDWLNKEYFYRLVGTRKIKAPKFIRVTKLRMTIKV